MSKKTVYLVSDDREINHDGELYTAGKKIQLDETAAEPLLAVRAIYLPEKDKAQAGQGESEG